jgi:hypothetical protein
LPALGCPGSGGTTVPVAEGPGEAREGGGGAVGAGVGHLETSGASHTQTDSVWLTVTATGSATGSASAVAAIVAAAMLPLLWQYGDYHGRA